MVWENVAAGEYDPESPWNAQINGKWVDRDDAWYDGYFCVKKNADQQVDNSAVLVDDLDFTWAVGANVIWFYHITLIVSTNAGATDLRLNWSLPAGAVVGARYSAYEAGALITSDFTTFAGDLQINYAGAAVDEPVVLNGYIDTAGVAGTAVLQHANWAAGVARWSRVTAHSVMEAHQQKDTM